MVAGGVVGPGAAGLGAAPLGGDRVLAEGLGGDRGRRLQDELAKRGGAGGLVRDPERSDLVEQAAGVQRLAGPAAGEQPWAVWVRGGGHVVPLVRRGQEESGERLGHWDGRVSESQEDLVAVAGDVIDGEAHDAAGGLGGEQHQAGRRAGRGRPGLAGQDSFQQVEAGALGGRLGAGDLETGQGGAAGRCPSPRSGRSAGSVPRGRGGWRASRRRRPGRGRPVSGRARRARPGTVGPG
ncbi:hypothetical protein FAIPA1_130148 [Frankia sp. AiPs1]